MTALLLFQSHSRPNVSKDDFICDMVYASLLRCCNCQEMCSKVRPLPLPPTHTSYRMEIENVAMYAHIRSFQSPHSSFMHTVTTKHEACACSQSNKTKSPVERPVIIIVHGVDDIDGIRFCPLAATDALILLLRIKSAVPHRQRPVHSVDAFMVEKTHRWWRQFLPRKTQFDHRRR